MRVLLWIVILGVALAALHQIALWAERRGWIYYKHRKASPGSLGNAFLEAQSLLEPGKQHVVESQRADMAEQDESGEPPDGGENDKAG